jgi:hypothetical protein
MQMKHWIRLLTLPTTLGIVLLVASPCPVRGQNDEANPQPAGRSVPALNGVIANGEEDQSLDALQPDMAPLTGVQTPTLGVPGLRHSYWVPGLQYGNMIQSQPFGQGNSSDWYVNNFVAGNVSLLDARSHAQLALNATAGGTSSTSSGQGSGFFSQLGLSQTFQWERWQLQFFDQFAYLPQSSFGFGAGTSLGIPGVGGPLVPPQPGLSGNYVPNQSIFTSVGPRYSNTFAPQAVYAVSPRGSINFAGVYGILRFVNSGNIDSNEVTGNIGYNYQLTTKDSIGVAERYSRFWYIGNPQVIGDNVVSIVYGRKVTGRLALQLYGGPDFATFAVPVGNKTSRVSASEGATLTYQFSRSTLGVNYNHGLTGGSGILVGANTDQIQANLGFGISRVWRGSVNFGYSRNQNLAGSQSQTGSTYDSWFAGGALSRPLGHNVSLSFAYSAQIQNSSAASCSSGNCNTNYNQNQISINFQWFTRPLVLH